MIPDWQRCDEHGGYGFKSDCIVCRRDDIQIKFAHLFRHYNVQTVMELIEAQDKHILRLQEKLAENQKPFNFKPSFPRG